MAAKEMGLLVAVRDFINTNGGPQVVLSEMLPFKKACSEEDKADYKAELESYGYVIKD